MGPHRFVGAPDAIPIRESRLYSVSSPKARVMGRHIPLPLCVVGLFEQESKHRERLALVMKPLRYISLQQT